MAYGNGLSSPAGSVKDIKPQAEIHLQVSGLVMSTLVSVAECSTSLLSAEYRPALCPMQVSKIAESGTDYRKFYINNGQKIMRLRAETKCALAQTDKDFQLTDCWQCLCFTHCASALSICPVQFALDSNIYAGRIDGCGWMLSTRPRCSLLS